MTGPPMGSRVLVIAGALLFAFLFLPWEVVVRSQPFLGIEGRTVYESGFGSPLGIVVGVLALALVAWELLAAAGRRMAARVHPARVGAAAGAVNALLAVVLFLSTLGETAWGAFVGVTTAVAMAYGAWLRSREATPARP